MDTPIDNAITSDEAPSQVTDMNSSIESVEKLLNYKFKNKKLLEDALTHPSCPNSPSYKRLEFVGDAVLGLAISKYIFLEYPDVDSGPLTLLRSANVSTEKFARVAVRHGLFNHVRQKTATLEKKVRDFTVAVQQEDETEVYGGVMQAPKILADIVESVAAAVYFDCGFDLQALWAIFRSLLEPLITLDVVQQKPHPVTKLFDLCQKDGKQVEIRHSRTGEEDIATVFVEGTPVASGSSEQKDNAELQAAKAALQELSYSTPNDKMDLDLSSQLNGTHEIEGAKQKLHDLCSKKRWPRPSYSSMYKESGPAHDRRFVCSVQIENVLSVTGDERLRVKDAENSAASEVLRGLQKSKYI